MNFPVAEPLSVVMARDKAAKAAVMRRAMDLLNDRYNLTPRYVESTAAEMAQATGRRVVPVIADMTKSAGVQRAVDTVMQTFGRIDVLVNNLGDAIRKPLVALPGRADAATALSDEELQFVMDINLTEAILCTRAVGPHLLARRAGKVINISSWTAGQGGGVPPMARRTAPSRQASPGGPP